MSSKWLRCRFQKADSSVNLICFPWAGGGTSYYTGSWGRKLQNTGIEVHAVCLPGRENRYKEPFYQDWQALVSDFCKDSHKELGRKQFAFWGHSFGALFCYEVAVKLKYQYGIEACHLLVSGASAPQVIIHPASRGYNDLSDEDLAERLRSWGGTPSAILENKEIMDLSVKMLRADLTLLEKYRYSGESTESILSCPITSFDGDKDLHEKKGFSELTTGEFSSHVLPGGHFYFFNNERPLLDLIESHLLPIFSKSATATSR
ncbi:predicted protein [Nematostella vectensis]|uniref:S-acyl fatty acid synthase thioesterase, medium chain n=1 Tax=Nematostella vectensis TaxID=45351 RepID=A7S355_NEMVE|nr:predicted protein [Nematostella vectensis]|eukprot:XP_001633966.1 predicted protein [Nematostella vectensis]